MIDTATCDHIVGFDFAFLSAVNLITCNVSILSATL